MISLTFLALTLPLFAHAANHQVQVGDSSGALKFSPEAIFAEKGDTVTFTFMQKNHSAIRSSFANPCGPLEGEGAFNANGFHPVSPDQTSDFDTFEITVQNDDPVWVYCPQQLPVSHCHKGMVFAVNCGKDGEPNSFSNFKAAAIAQGATDASSSAAPPASPTDAPSSFTIPPEPAISTVTQTVTVESSTWTTTYGSYPNSPAPTPASLEGNVIRIIVGTNGTLTYNPSSVRALPRDTLVFEFQSKNHTVTQSSFADPCKKLNNETTGQVGFDSGFQPVAAGATTFPTWNFTVPDVSPIWLYCRQTNPSSHCGQGMVMAVNADNSSPRNVDAFTALAKAKNGSSNAATPASGSGSSPSPSPSSGASRVTATGLGLVGLVGGLMATL